MVKYILLFVVSIPLFARGQVSPEEAKRKLDERTAVRQAERSKSVQITLGELEDLRNRLRMLETENASLKQQIAAAASAKQKPKPWTKIDLGMTRTELVAFVNAHPHDFRVSGITASTGKSSLSRETVRRSSSGSATAIQRNDGPTRIIQRQGDAGSAETVENRINGPKTETIEIDVLIRTSVVTGSSRDVLGGDHPVYGVEYQRSGGIRVELTDDVVSAVEAHVN